MSRLNRQVTGGVPQADVHWVVTVPAIWDEDAKQFIIAAIEAGIGVDRLSLALEPEAASIYCRHVEMTRTDNSSDANMSTFQPGTRYIVCDAGGGTVDITVHEVTPDKKLMEIEKASGGDWGGTKVDEAFVRFIDALTGDAVVQELKNQHMDDYLELIRTFERIKRAFKRSSSQKIMFKFPQNFFDCVSHLTGKSFTEHIERSSYKSKLCSSSDKIRFDAIIISDFFAAPVRSIVEQLATILEKYRDINHIVMVGGFSESKLLQDDVINTFPGKHVIIPVGAEEVVMKGAVIYGHNPRQIVSRIARYTYGISCWLTYDASIHPANTVVQEGKRKGKVENCFSKLVEIGQSIPTDEPAGSKVFNAIDDKTKYAAVVYATKAKHPVFIHDDGCFKIGSFDVNCKDKNGKISSTVIKMYFGGTTLDFKASLKTTGEDTEATFDIPD